MFLHLFSIFDVVAGTYGDVFLQPTIGAGARHFEFLYHSSPDHSLFRQHISNFTLHCLGDFNIESGKLRPLDAPTIVISGASFLRDDTGKA